MPVYSVNGLDFQGVKLQDRLLRLAGTRLGISLSWKRRYNLFFLILIGLNFFATRVYGCDWKAKEIISLSGPMTHLIYELGLLSSSKMRGISALAGISPPLFSGDLLSGGLFLSTEYLKKYSDPLIFFDEGRELSLSMEKIKSRFSQKEGGFYVIETRGKDPFDVSSYLLDRLRPHLVNCEKKILQLEKKLKKIKEELLDLPPFTQRIVFYLGALKDKERPPDLVMVADAFILFWQSHQKIKTYPSDLSYVSWSQKILTQMKKEGEVIEVGLVGEKLKEDQGLYQMIKVLGKGKKINIYGPTLLIPGLPQIYFMREFSQWPPFK